MRHTCRECPCSLGCILRRVLYPMSLSILRRVRLFLVRLKFSIMIFVRGDACNESTIVTSTTVPILGPPPTFVTANNFPRHVFSFDFDPMSLTPLQFVFYYIIRARGFCALHSFDFDVLKRCCLFSISKNMPPSWLLLPFPVHPRGCGAGILNCKIKLPNFGSLAVNIVGHNRHFWVQLSKNRRGVFTKMLACEGIGGPIFVVGGQIESWSKDKTIVRIG